MWSESLQAATRGQGAEQPCRQHMVVGRTEKECVSKTVRTKIRQNVRLVSSSPLRHLSSGRASEAQGLCVVLTKHTEILYATVEIACNSPSRQPSGRLRTLATVAATVPGRRPRSPSAATPRCTERRQLPPLTST